jgi:hypothetical protein
MSGLPCRLPSLPDRASIPLTGSFELPVLLDFKKSFSSIFATHIFIHSRYSLSLIGIGVGNDG